LEESSSLYKNSVIGSEDDAYVLNDLADLRNDIAHGTEVTILSPEMLAAYIKYIDVFGASLCDVLKSEWLRVLLPRKGIEIGAAIKVIDRRIVCFGEKDRSISVGDILVSKSDSDHFVCGPILQMQVNRTDVERLERVGGEGVGIRVDFRPKGNHQFFLWPMPVPESIQPDDEADLFSVEPEATGDEAPQDAENTPVSMPEGLPPLPIVDGMKDDDNSSPNFFVRCWAQFRRMFAWH
jgi:hypothetical protein